MEATNIWHLCHVHLRKVGLLAILLVLPLFAHSQVNYLEMGNKSIYFGISLGLNFSKFKIDNMPLAVRADSIDNITSKRGPGFNVGIIGNLQFNKHLDLRAIPGLVFSDKILEYEVPFQGRPVTKTISSIYLDFPLMLRFKSEPVGDVQVFVLGGLRYQFDLASNATARQAEDQVKLKRHDFSLEYGIGFSFYFPYFILSPELKFTHGLIDIHARDEKLIYSRAIDKLFNRTITISINFEG